MSLINIIFINFNEKKKEFSKRGFFVIQESHFNYICNDPS